MSLLSTPQILLLVQILEATIRMDKNFRISVNSLVKLLVGHFSFFNVDLMRDNEAGLSTTRNDEISEISVVRLDVTLASADSKPLSEC